MRTLLEESFRAAVAAADPLKILPPHLPRPPRGRTYVAAAGKAAASMALAVEQHWPRGAALSGLAITRYAHGLPAQRIRVVEAGHPVPDAAGEAGARELLAGVRALGPDDLLLALVSGGGSSLLSLPAQGVTMDGLKAMTRELLRCGAPIQEINTVRKHLSAIQGGRLAAACRAPVLALIVSDVTGDDPTHIASGPCAPDPTTIDDARAVLRQYGIPAPGPFTETPKPGDALFGQVENRVIATARRSLEAAAALFAAKGFAPTVLGDNITGEASEVAKAMAEQARNARRPSVLISGGECTVTVRGAGGRGGRCGEFLLALALALEGVPNVHAIAADTDGIDGSEDNAGALVSPDTLARAVARGLDARKLLAANDSYAFFSALGDLVVTGPTRTNVNDYRAILLASAP
ncbi:MAG: glycerate kinase [Betaproteobacteria bacterium]|nr:glycerate kinase [Betaproteobacteria bacterium]